MLLLGAVAWWAMMRKPIVRRRARRWSCDAGPPDPLAHPRVTREIRSTRCPEQDLPGASSWRTGKEPSDDGLTERLRGTPGHAETLRDVVGLHERFRHAHRREPRRGRHVPVPGNGTGPGVATESPSSRPHAVTTPSSSRGAASGVITTSNGRYPSVARPATWPAYEAKSCAT